MKKILIVNNNLDMGGIQKSLVNLLNAVHTDYEITLLLFSKSGVLLKNVPDDVKIITPRKCYRILGLTKNELKRYPFLFVLKFLLMKFASLFSRRSAVKLLGLFQKKIRGYDAVISYSHLPNHRSFSNGCGDFVLDKTVCENKICLVHCDYINSGCMTESNNREYFEFNKVACCSDSVRARFTEGSGLKENIFTLRNFFGHDVCALAEKDPFEYDDNYVNIVSVARLSPEKGVDIAIDVLSKIGRKDIRYYVIGDGPQRELLQGVVKADGLSENVFFLGEQDNPYRYMKKADYLLVPSLHEAAPMVFDEAKVLGLKIISTNTTSAIEMIGDDGIVCDNSFDGIEFALSALTKGVERKQFSQTNQLQKNQLAELVC